MGVNGLYASSSVDLISGAHILSPSYDPTLQYNIHITDAKIQDIQLHNRNSNAGSGIKVLDAHNYLIAPSLCHAHVHLDKCFLLSDPKYTDLEIVNGDFAEAMELTSKAKRTFERDDLLRRGKWLIAESVAAGVTHMRAFAEVDHVVGFKCLDAAVELKGMFEGACEIQVCAFAQEALYSGDYAKENKDLMERAVSREEVGAIGSTPYVERDKESLQLNINWAVETAQYQYKHLDLHLDYNLDPRQESSLAHVVNCLIENEWCYDPELEKGNKVALGHCTRLTQLSAQEWQDVATFIKGRPIHFVGLPTSDLFIQGKPSPGSGGGERVRGTLQIPQMIEKYNLSGCISINNVGNAFTPYGSCDPLSIASMGVGLYHAGTKQDAQILYECVSRRAKRAIGYPSDPFAVGQSADFVLFEMGGAADGPLSKQRGRRTLQEVVYDPPKGRKTVYRGRVIVV